MHPCASASTAALLALAASALVSCGKSSDQIPSSDPPAVAPPAPAASGLVVEDKNFPMPAPGTCKLGQRDGRVVPVLVARQVRLTPPSLRPTFATRSASPTGARRHTRRFRLTAG